MLQFDGSRPATVPGRADRSEYGQGLSRSSTVGADANHVRVKSENELLHDDGTQDIVEFVLARNNVTATQ